jgi:Autographiviridae endonuclease VII
MTKEERKIYNINYKETNKELLKVKNKVYSAKTVEKRKNYYWNNIEKLKENQKVYYHKNKEKILERSKEYSRNNKDKIKHNKLKYEFNISLKDYDNILLQQNNCCKICKRNQFEISKKLAIDHCHSTGKVRGLLCQNCNTGLGQFKDNKEFLIEAIKYLE